MFDGKDEVEKLDDNAGDGQSRKVANNQDSRKLDNGGIQYEKEE